MQLTEGARLVLRGTFTDGVRELTSGLSEESLLLNLEGALYALLQAAEADAVAREQQDIDAPTITRALAWACSRICVWPFCRRNECW